MQTFKLFVSSPGDVMVERRRVENVASRLNGEFAGVARLEVIRWETKNYQAFQHFSGTDPALGRLRPGDRHFEVAAGNRVAA